MSQAPFVVLQIEAMGGGVLQQLVGSSAHEYGLNTGGKTGLEAGTAAAAVAGVGELEGAI
jgi:hypothetical protein